jgi:predicted ATP-binding protein involved in virulence
VILGDNGTGKTTLLQCLVALELSIDKETAFLIRHNKRLLLLDETHLLNLLRYDEPSRSSQENVVVETSSFYAGCIHSETFRNIDGLNVFSVGALAFEPSLRNLIVYAYGASRHMGHGSLSDTQENASAASLFFDDVSLINAEEWLLQAYFAVQNSEPETKAYFENRYDNIKETLIHLLDDVSDFRIKPITKTQTKPAIEVETPYGWVDMKALSLGYQALIAWVVDLASRLFDRYPDSENPLAESAIVLVDEIDLHLHPKWQRTIISYLTDIFKNTQFIVTAHSPLIVQAATDANVVLLKREGDHVVIHNRKEHDMIKGWRLDQVLTSDLFDISSARPPQYDASLKRQREILAKAKLSPEDEQELEDLAKKLDELQPVLEKQEDREAMRILRKAADILQPEPVHS